MKTNSLFAPVIGIDLGDLRHAVCVIDHEGNTLGESKITNTRDSFTKLAETYPGSRIAIEVGTHSLWISRLLTDPGCEVIVANSCKLRATYQNERKSDELDARMLARADVSLLHPVKHGSEQAQCDLLRIKLRDNLVRQRVNVISSGSDLLSRLSGYACPRLRPVAL